MRRTRHLVVLGLVIVAVVITVVAVMTSTKSPSSSTSADRAPAMSLANLRAHFVADETVASDVRTWNHAASVLATVREATNNLRRDLGLPPIASA